MALAVHSNTQINERVRAILLTQNGKLMFIKRVKPLREPYWVAPGGGVEDTDNNLYDALRRELHEELGATARILAEAFVLEHNIAGKNLREHFFICEMVDYDLYARTGPEFDDPERGEYLPSEVALDVEQIQSINIKTPELQTWLVNNIDFLRTFADQHSLKAS